MAKYKAYPEYKDSGVEWLGEIPIHWEMLRHKYVAFFTKGKNPTNLLEQPLKNTLPYLSMECLRNNTTDKYALISNDVRVALEGQPLIIWDGSNAGEFVKGKLGILSSTMAAATLTYPLHSQYYWYLCISIEPEMRKNSVGMGIPHVNGDELKSISFGIPSIYEQKQIAEFLDHETAKIDNLIEKQQQLIELLKEKRQAVISHAVTKGLNPDVPMKDSGVEWLGEVPKHWVPIQLGKVCYQVSDGPHFSPNYVDSGVLFISARNIKVNGWSLDDAKYITEKDYNEFSKRVVPEIGDVLYTKGGTTGIARTVDIEDKFQVWVHVAVLKILKDKAVPDFIAYSLNGTSCYAQSQLYTQGATNNDLGLTRLIKIWLALSPKNEQQEIVDALNSITKKYDVITDNAMTAITILQERRTALISAAVTGKIDVRDWVAPDTQDVEEPEEATA